MTTLKTTTEHVIATDFVIKNDTYTLNLSFVEMHILINAMQEYQRAGNNPSTNKPENFNVAHANAAEQLYSEMVDFYCAD